MQNAAFQAAGLDAVYVGLRLQADDVAAQMLTLARTGGGGNVTVPFKEVASGATGGREARVELLGSANVFGGVDGVLQLGNSDVDGILSALDQLDAPRDAWCVLGTGGSALPSTLSRVVRGIVSRSMIALGSIDIGSCCASARRSCQPLTVSPGSALRTRRVACRPRH